VDAGDLVGRDDATVVTSAIVKVLSWVSLPPIVA
jgi:hypothetical protein